ncbi:MAG: Rieske 2Fe-2S domain-containing protein [Oligoflexales bacterium]|nr:Rieske 2Fe-2S domain-containing protein [Oligoflexales bacterium]
MFGEAGGLNKFWHVCAFSHEIKQSPLSIKIYNTPIVLWRNKSQDIHALLDSCPHRGSPLSAGHCQDSTITCPYHGWTFDHSGACKDIPCEDPRFKVRKKIPAFEVFEELGLVWIYLDHKSKASAPPVSLEPYQEKGWTFIYRKKLFHTSAPLLLENFMDSSHTSFVHKGLIRGIGEKSKRMVEVSCDDKRVLVSHPESKEQVGVGSSFVIGKGATVSHTDEFILPSIVKVDYHFQPKNRGFLAFIFCTPITPTQTMAHVMIGLRFGAFNFFIKPILPIIIRKILKQDEQITRLQQENLSLPIDSTECDTPSDYMHRQVKNLRSKYASKDADQGEYRVGTKKFPAWF